VPEIEPVDEVVPRILQRYSEKPRGWRILSTPVGDMLVLGPDSAFQLKLIPLSPMEFTGAGVELSSERHLDPMTTSPEFGFRPLHDKDIQSLIESISSPELVRPEIDSIIKRTPMTLAQLNTTTARHILSGPILTRPDLSTLNQDVLKTQTSLERKARSIFRDRYPMRAGMYG
jgi:hypothetical protein